MKNNSLPDFRSWGGDKKFTELTETDVQKETNLPILRFLQRINNKRPDTTYPLRILDLGCGRGELVGQLRCLGFDAYGVDIDARFIKAGDILNKKKNTFFPILSVSNSNGKTLFEDNFFDIVISNQVLEHVSNIDNIAQEMSRFLKTSGVVFNLFPARFRIFEPHYRLPFVHWLPKSNIRRIMISLFIRIVMASRFFPNYTLAERTEIVYKFSVEDAFYRPLSDIIDSFRSHGIELNARKEMRYHLNSYNKRFSGLVRVLSKILPIDILVTNFRHVMLSGVKHQKPANKKR